MDVRPDSVVPEGGNQELKDSSLKANTTTEDVRDSKIRKTFKHTPCCRRGLWHEHEECKHICCQENSRKERNRLKPKSDVDVAIAAVNAAAEKGDIAGLAPPSKLGQFYEFFSFSHLASPVQLLRRSLKQQLDSLAEGDLFAIDVKLCNGKFVTVIACTTGFYSSGKQQVKSYTLVALLRQISKAFSNAYEDLIKAFVERNKFGNIPYGLRANTWVVPPISAESASIFSALPAEDEAWGGTGGGHGGDETNISRPWAKEFLILAKMPCQTVEERQVRDRKAFLLHSLFVDTAVIHGTAVINHVEELNMKGKLFPCKEGKIYEEYRGTLKISVIPVIANASKKSDVKVDGLHVNGMTIEELKEKNLLKGITADESTTVHDTATLGLVIIHHLGYTAVVEAMNSKEEQQVGELLDIQIEDQPEGGANALNVNSLRTLLHGSSTRFTSDSDEHNKARALIGEIIEESLKYLDEQESHQDAFIRWELGACWLQHLQSQTTAEKSDEKGGIVNKQDTAGKKLSKVQVPIESSQKKIENPRENISEKARLVCDPLGLNKKFEQRKHVEKTEENIEDTKDKVESKELEAEAHLKSHLSDAAFTRLKESKSGLHVKSIPDLIDGIHKYYDDVALPKLVSDFGSLELSPVDGRTLTDFMHTRGLRMCSLGRVAELSGKLPHVQSLCIHEMVIRALKNALRAVVAATKHTSDLAMSIATTLNIMLGTHSENVLESSSRTPESMMSLWLVKFIEKRFGWKLSLDPRPELRKFAVLRGICHKVGIEIAPRDYELETPTPFKKMDIISMVPVYKQVACSSADGRTLLESSKTALDKGKLDDAVTYGTKALGKLIAVCGPYHRMTAGAYSLLAVVLYHTGDFNQATIYQQKALDINERELGLDHPDTMKSYGDLAVFYYRLQHTELALKYVNRALYLLHLICGPSHPNTAATYINVAMMEEGLGNVHVALRYLHEALKCNQRLLGADHIQTAASYHAIAIALSLMEAYSLSVQHEQTTLQILQAKLGPDDLRTQDAAAWLEYFDSKAVEQQEAARTGAPKPDASIASKGHLSVSDLLDYINAGVESKHKDFELFNKKPRHTKSKGRSFGLSSINSDDFNKDFISDEEQRSSDDQNVEIAEPDGNHPLEASVDEEGSVTVDDLLTITSPASLPNTTMDASLEEEGWQEAVSRSRNLAGGARKSWRRGPTLTRAVSKPMNKNNRIIRDRSFSSVNATVRRSSVSSATNNGSLSQSNHSVSRPEKVYVPRKQGNTSVAGGPGDQPTSNTSATDLPAASQPLISLNKSVVSKNLKSAQRPHSPLGEVTTAGVSLPPEQANSVETENATPNLSSQTSSLALIYSPSNKPAPSYKEVALAAPGTCLLVRHVNETSTSDKPQLEINESKQSTASTSITDDPGKKSLSQQVSAPSDSPASELELTETFITVTPSALQSGAVETSSEKDSEREAVQDVQGSSSADSGEIVSKPLEGSGDVDSSEAPCEVDRESTQSESSINGTSLDIAKSSGDDSSCLASNDISTAEEQSEMPATPQTPSSSSEAPKKLSAAAPPFSPVASVSRTTASGIVAVTPFKDGKAPQSGGGLSPRSFEVSSGQTAIALTPIRKNLQLLSAPQSESPLQIDEAGGDATLLISRQANNPEFIEVERQSTPPTSPSPPPAPTSTEVGNSTPPPPPPKPTSTEVGHSAPPPTSTEVGDLQQKPLGDNISQSPAVSSPKRPATVVKSNGVQYVSAKSMNPNAAEFVPGRIWHPSQQLHLPKPSLPVQATDDAAGKQQNNPESVSSFEKLSDLTVNEASKQNFNSPVQDFQPGSCNGGSLTSHSDDSEKLPGSEIIPPEKFAEETKIETIESLTVESTQGRQEENEQKKEIHASIDMQPEPQKKVTGAGTTKLWADLVSSDSETEDFNELEEAVASHKQSSSDLRMDETQQPEGIDIKLQPFKAENKLGIGSIPNHYTENGNTAFEGSESGGSGSEDSAATSVDLQHLVQEEALPYVTKRQRRSSARRAQELEEGDRLNATLTRRHRRRSSSVKSPPPSHTDSFRGVARRPESSSHSASASTAPPTECLLPAQPVVSVR
ncbi:hypothetical protein O6H91_Y223600 [Diphasiastrum complanatum]|nr:hypothetical protein O6H91_Y223600 [Diphasiastrum complanatum]